MMMMMMMMMRTRRTRKRKRIFSGVQKNPAQASSLRELARCIHGGDTHAVKYLISGAIRYWSTHDDPYNPDISEYPPHLHSLITSALDSQAKIGWEQMMKGFLSTTWRTLASKDMFAEKPTHDDRQGESTIKTTMKGLAEHFSRLWEARNKVLHDTKDEEMCDVRSMEIAEIKYYFSRPHLLRFDDRHYCEGSLAKLLNGRSSNRRRWLRRVKTSIEIQKVQGSRQTRITSYFSPT
jgi:hypothetical protein